MSDTYTFESSIELKGSRVTLLSVLRNDSTGEALERKASDISGQLYVAGFREGRESLHGLLQELAPALPPALREKVERVLR